MRKSTVILWILLRAEEGSDKPRSTLSRHEVAAQLSRRWSHPAILCILWTKKYRQECDAFMDT